MFKMSLDQHRRNLRRIQSFMDTSGAMSVPGDKFEMAHELLELSLSDNTPTLDEIRSFLTKWKVIEYWDEYQAINMIQDILDYRLN